MVNKLYGWSLTPPFGRSGMCIILNATPGVSCSLRGVLVLVKEIYTVLGMLRLVVDLLFLGYTAATPLLWDGRTLHIFQSDE